MLRRTGFKRPERERPARQPVTPCSSLHRGVYVQAGDKPVVVPKGIKAKPGKRKPTVAEAKWMDAIVEYGCIACKVGGFSQSSETAVHHILRGGRRMGHLFTLPLCDPGHHQGGELNFRVSRHPWKARFEAKYGTEFELLAKLKQELGVFDSAEYST